MARPFLAAGLVLVAQTYAWADGPIQDIARSPAPSTPEYLKKFEGSTAEVSTYIGSGSFYVSGYRDPYASLAIFIKPSYSLGTRYKLAVRARLYAEEEFTTPDTPNGRRFYPYDPWVWLAADNLKTFERSKIRIGGVVRAIFPLSYESRYEHNVVALGTGPNINRDFEFGQVNDEARKWTLKLTYSLLFYKDFQTSDFRGSGPNDRTACFAPSGGGSPGLSAGEGPSGGSTDRCGGPANTNYVISEGFFASLARGKLSLTTSLLVQNSFKYAFPADAMTSDNAALTGRSDMTWGIVAIGYQLRPHVTLSWGVSSLQPALDSRYRYPRFPFWDLSGGNANNYSQMFFSVGGSL